MDQHCKHVYLSDHEWCTQAASPGSDYCVWHDPQVSKADAYVAELLATVITMVQGDLTEYQLNELDWPNAKLSHMVLDGVSLRDAHLPRAQLVETSLKDANLRRCNLRKANLHGANLSGCDLKHTDLGGADLTEANLSGAQLSDTNLMGANLRGAHLENIHVESFRWNDRTNFEGVTGLDASDTENDETQAFLTPVALANFKKSQSSTVAPRDEILTHEYRSHASAVEMVDLHKAAGEIKTSSIKRNNKDQTPTPFALSNDSDQSMRSARKRLQLLSFVTAAALLVTFGACAFGVWAYQKLQNRPSIIKEVTVTKEVPVKVMVPNTEIENDPQFKRLSKQHQQLVEQHAALRESYRTSDMQIKNLEQKNLDKQMELTRLQLRNDEIEIKLHEYQQLQERHKALKRHTSRLNDTASILAKGVDRLSTENDQLNELKNKRLNAQSQLELLQTKTLQLQHENDSLRKENDTVREHNQSLLAELTGARKSLERFMSRIEGSRLHAFLTKDASQVQAIPIQADKPIVLSGDHLITLEIKSGKQNGFIESKLFVQAGVQGQMPDVNVIFYNAQMKAIRSISYGFPAEDSKDNFAVSTAHFNSPNFPSFVRILVNPGIEKDLLATNPSAPKLR